MTTQDPGLKWGAELMLIAALVLIGYGVAFFIRNLASTVLGLGVETLWSWLVGCPTTTPAGPVARREEGDGRALLTMASHRVTVPS